MTKPIVPSPSRASSAMAIAGAAIAAIVSQAAPAAAQQSVSDLLLRQTEAFSQASSQGEGEVMRRLLDDRVVFFNEGGDVATKADMIASARAPAAGVTVTQTIDDWHCEVHGDTAVGSFIDDQVATVAGVATRARFRSVETWRREDDGAWRMIGSETIALQDDPVAVDLPAATLAEYAGNYADSSGIRFVFAVQDGHLVASVNGGPVSAQKAEVRDVVFTPGHARFRKVFQRDAHGRVVAFAYRREGHDTIFRRVA